MYFDGSTDSLDYSWVFPMFWWIPTILWGSQRIVCFLWILECWLGTVEICLMQCNCITLCCSYWTILFFLIWNVLLCFKNDRWDKCFILFPDHENYYKSMNLQSVWKKNIKESIHSFSNKTKNHKTMCI